MLELGRCQTCPLFEDSVKAHMLQRICAFSTSSLATGLIFLIFLLASVITRLVLPHHLPPTFLRFPLLPNPKACPLCCYALVGRGSKLVVVSACCRWWLPTRSSLINRVGRELCFTFSPLPDPDRVSPLPPLCPMFTNFSRRLCIFRTNALSVCERHVLSLEVWSRYCCKMKEYHRLRRAIPIPSTRHRDFSEWNFTYSLPISWLARS